MTWWTVYETATGENRGHGSVDPTPLRPGLSFFTTADRQDQENVWDPTLPISVASWVPRPPKRNFRVRDLLNDFTPREITLLINTDSTETQKFMKGLTIYEFRDTVNYDDPEIDLWMTLLVDSSPQVMTEARKDTVLGI